MNRLGRHVVTRAEFESLAAERLEEAKILLDAGKWAGAYYLAGYAVELALKACIIKRLMQTDAFPERKFSENCYTHSLVRLVSLAGLEEAFDAARLCDPDLDTNWSRVKDWSESTRYQMTSETDSNELYEAISNPKTGVQPWIKNHWQ